jgi:hypothetical protein
MFMLFQSKEKSLFLGIFWGGGGIKKAVTP